MQPLVHMKMYAAINLNTITYIETGAVNQFFSINFECAWRLFEMFEIELKRVDTV